VELPDGAVVEASLTAPGEHNVLNGTAVVAIAVALGQDAEEAATALSSFGGVKRRFETVGRADGVWVVDDYAHHPTEVRATLAAARGAGARRVWVVFQPHRYSRTAALGHEFGEAFGDADRVVMMDVYGAGETPIPGVSGKSVVDAILDVDARTAIAYFPHRADLDPYLVERLGPGDLLMTMGAGDVTMVGGEVLRALDERAASRAAR
jgi:UDP-N-acetylmuramate--alanine ligase